MGNGNALLRARDLPVREPTSKGLCGCSGYLPVALTRIIWHIEAETKWPPSSWRTKMHKFRARFHWSFFQKVGVNTFFSISSDNGLSPTRWQAIIWSNDGHCLTHICVNWSQWLKFTFMELHRSNSWRYASELWRTCVDIFRLLSNGTYHN